jgi:galactokinase
MMGGGFGGCTINLIENSHIEEISTMVAEKYKKKFQADFKMYCTSIGPGTNILTSKNHAEA